MSDITPMGNMNFQSIRDIGVQRGAALPPKVNEEPTLLGQGEAFVPSGNIANDLLMDKIKSGGITNIGIGNHELEPTITGKDISDKSPEVPAEKTFAAYYGGIDDPDSYYGFSLNGPSSNSIVGLSGQELK